MTRRPAAFLDRDGTIIVDTGFVRDPSQVQLIPGSAKAIRRLNQAGWAVVVVTNQSGIARGIITWEQYHAVARRIDELLAAEGARIDATYVCPHHPEITGPCECRKPGLAHYRAAIETLELDPARSVFIGDRLTDLEPAGQLGGTGVLVRAGGESSAGAEVSDADMAVVGDLASAVAGLLEG